VPGPPGPQGPPGTGLIDYSTSEQWTGLLWLDGRKIYQKTINCGTVAGGAGTAVPHGIANIALVTGLEAIAFEGTTFVHYPFVAPDPTQNMGVYTTTTDIQFLLGSAQPSYNVNYATLRYTCTDR
jgi:hypothetical protein